MSKRQASEAGAAAQMTQAMTNIAAVFSAASLDLAASSASCWVYGFNADTFGDISSAYYTFFPVKGRHPARNPTGAILILNGALVGVRCRGFPGGGVRVAPPNFFSDDLNAQGLLVDGATHLYTSAQLGIDPISHKLAAGGAVNETRQALQNIARVFETAFPEVGANALTERSSGCQVIIANDTGSGAESVWPAVEAEFAKYFPGGVVRTVYGFPGGALPLPATVAVTCNGVGTGVKRTVLDGGKGVVAVVAGMCVDWSCATTQLQASAQLGADVRAAFTSTAAVFADVFSSAGWRCAAAPCHPSIAASILQATATECELWLADPAADVDAALTTLNDLFGGRARLPAMTVTKAALPSAAGRARGRGRGTGVGGDAALVALQCFGSYTQAINGG